MKKTEMKFKSFCKETQCFYFYYETGVSSEFYFEGEWAQSQLYMLTGASLHIDNFSHYSLFF